MIMRTICSNSCSLAEFRFAVSYLSLKRKKLIAQKKLNTFCQNRLEHAVLLFGPHPNLTKFLATSKLGKLHAFLLLLFFGRMPGKLENMQKLMS